VIGDTLELFAGPGGWDEGARMAGLDLQIDGYDFSPAACATATAAGHHRTVADVRSLRFDDFADVTGAILSPPCPTFSSSGLRSGIADYQQVLDTWTSLGWGIPFDEAITCVEDVKDDRTALLAIAGAWALALPALEWVAMEQVPKVEFAWEDLAAELYSIGWESVDVVTLDAADYGLPSRRRRTFLLGRRYEPLAPLSLERARVSMADALGWDAGHRINTRGDRKATGGNWFSADGPSWCLTGSSRTWYREDGLRMTPGEAGALVGFRPDYPWQGSRSAAFLQAADVVAPPIAAAVLSAATRRASTRDAFEMRAAA
jgi:DNA (cytosine-5)-methyltransferase 1